MTVAAGVEYKAGPSSSTKSTDDEHRVRVLAGYKAALSNPRTTDAGREHAQKMIDGVSRCSFHSAPRSVFDADGLLPFPAEMEGVRVVEDEAHHNRGEEEGPQFVFPAATRLTQTPPLSFHTVLGAYKVHDSFFLSFL